MLRLFGLLHDLFFFWSRGGPKIAASIGRSWEVSLITKPSIAGPAGARTWIANDTSLYIGGTRVDVRDRLVRSRRQQAATLLCRRLPVPSRHGTRISFTRARGDGGSCPAGKRSVSGSCGGTKSSAGLRATVCLEMDGLHLGVVNELTHVKK